MKNLNDLSVQVSVNDLEKEIHDLENRLKESRTVLSYIKRKQVEVKGLEIPTNQTPNIATLDISLSDMTYLNDNLLKKSQKRINLHKQSIERTGKAVHYQDFVNRVNQLGDNVKDASYYATVWRVCQKYGMKKIGGGYFDIENSENPNPVK